MVEIGTVFALLDGRRTLLKSTRQLDEGSVVRVFARVGDERVSSVAGIPYVEITKGHLRVSTAQAEGIYLAEVYNLREGEYQLVPEPSPFQRLLEGTANFPRQKTAKVEEPSGKLNTGQSLGLKVDTTIQVGDLITLD